ncbi:amidase signature enzyme [Corynespora cassiicola Philippines]|uniref:Amidase signature enzyme n=1 Tax=Corynespora cassiicola Philippines TaxID=1448308 RepID=A0A2T2NYT0_CORCC|nr:amidase signature enzyme [Corynespora cassiicola Philippines]
MAFLSSVESFLAFLMQGSFVLRWLGEVFGLRTATVDLTRTSIVDLREGLDKGYFSAKYLVKAYIKRIEELNPRVCAISQINPDALDIARERDEERKVGRSYGLLHGIPIVVKDLFLTTDKLESSNGCSGLSRARPKFEATTIGLLRDQGAILLGKTAAMQWANYRSPGQAPGGWSAVGGQCLAPYHENLDPSGSSSGSDVATSLGMAAASSGTETDGSLSSPAQRSCVVSLKPTVGLTSRHGVYPVSEWQDTVGVIAQTVKDAALVLTAIAAPDEEDPHTISDERDAEGNMRPPQGTDITQACRDNTLEGTRIAVPRHLLENEKNDVVDGAFDEALKQLENLGATIVDNVKFTEFDKDLSYSDADDWMISFRLGRRENMKRFLANYDVNPHGLHTLADVMNYTRDTLEEMNEKWGMKELEKCEELAKTYSIDSDEYRNSLNWRNRIGGQISELLSRSSTDMLVVPSSLDASANVGGCPTVGVPLEFFPENQAITTGRSSGLVTNGPRVPFGLMFVGKRWDDEKMISAAYAFEQASRVREKGQQIFSSDTKL